MKYVSTRNKNVFLSASETIAQGLADDGGLLTPEVFPKLTPETVSYTHLTLPTILLV